MSVFTILGKNELGSHSIRGGSIYYVRFGGDIFGRLKGFTRTERKDASVAYFFSHGIISFIHKFFHKNRFVFMFPCSRFAKIVYGLRLNIIFLTILKQLFQVLFILTALIIIFQSIF